MYFCIRCNITHVHSATETIFLGGFTKKEGQEINVGYCKASESIKTKSDSLEEKLAYLKRHAS